MKVAVSIPDKVFSEAEDLAKRLKASRSEIFSRALGEHAVSVAGTIWDSQLVIRLPGSTMEVFGGRNSERTSHVDGYFGA